MRSGGYKLRAKVLDPAATETELEQTANEFAEYDGDKSVGEMDFLTFRIKLSDPKHPHFG